MAEKSVTLQHIVRREGRQAVFFYDGNATAVDGLLTLPADRPEWIRRAFASGYVLDPKTGRRLMTWAEVEALMAEGDSAKSAKESAKSTEEPNEDTDAGRQSKTENRVRKSKRDSSGDVSEPESRSDRSRSTTDRKPAPDPTGPISLPADSAK